MKRFSAGVDPTDLLKEREAILTLLPQTSPMTLQKDISKYTIDPVTRYGNINKLVAPRDVSYLYDTDISNAVNTVCISQPESVNANLTESGECSVTCMLLC